MTWFTSLFCCRRRQSVRSSSPYRSTTAAQHTTSDNPTAIELLPIPKQFTKEKTFSPSLEDVLSKSTMSETIQIGRAEATLLALSFREPGVQWREGFRTQSFCYLLADPMLLVNSQSMTEFDRYAAFLSSIFYVGKATEGKTSRSHCYSHLFDALNSTKVLLYNDNQLIQSSDKLAHIRTIWARGQGVIIVRFMYDLLDVDALSRQASMISALGLHNLTNAKQGTFYGATTTWSDDRRNKFGAFCLYNALLHGLIGGFKQVSAEQIAKESS